MVNISADERLFMRAQSSNEGFAELFEEYYDRVYAYAYRRVHVQQIAEDIAECTFEDALKGIDKARWQGKPIVAWLFRIASRRIADHFRTRETLPLDEELHGSWEEQSGSLERSERQIAVTAALRQLGSIDREMIQLTYFDELEPNEIASFLGISRNNVYVRLHRALGHLQDLLEWDGA